jgi:hypothetical protein
VGEALRARMVPVVPSRGGEEETEGLVSRHVLSSLCFVGKVRVSVTSPNCMVMGERGWIFWRVIATDCEC